MNDAVVSILVIDDDPVQVRAIEALLDVQGSAGRLGPLYATLQGLLSSAVGPAAPRHAECVV